MNNGSPASNGRNSRAWLRAARRAREIARQTGTALVIVKDGVLVEERVDDDAQS